MANTSLNKTLGTPTNNYKWTISCWVKRATLGDQTIMSARVDGNNNGRLYFNSSNQLSIVDYQSTNKMELVTTSVYKDVGAWYNIVVSSDNSIGSPVTKIYVNGTETTNSTNTQYSQNQANLWNSAIAHYIGQNGASASYFDGSLSHFHFVDGTAYPASTFGSTDSVTGEWKINTSPSITMGNNGFTILKDGNTITDSSPNSNNWTLGGGTLSKSEDNPSNVFCTLNPLDVMKQSGGIYVPTFSNGNTTMSASATNNYQTFGSIAVDTGKYYWEMKVPNYDPNLGARIGLFHGDNKVHSGSYYYGADGYNVHQNGSIYTNGSSTSYMATFSDNIIITFALDKTNGLSYVGANGYWADGNGNTNQSFANAVAVETKLSTTMPDKTTYAMFDVYGSTTQHINFGNGYFGTTAVSSAGTNASGNGIFEYDVPSGYTALSTIGLNT